MSKGWISLHRQIMSNELWFSEPFTRAQAWIDLLLLANHTKGIVIIRGNIVPIKRGQVGWSEHKLSKRWQWSRGKVRRYLKWLKTVQQIEQQDYNKITSIITICNYESYQDGTTDGPQTDHRRYPNNNVNNVNNENTTVPDGTEPTIVYGAGTTEEAYSFKELNI